MARSLWSGALPVGGPLTLYVEVLSATEKYRGSDTLKQVCQCHHKPLTRTEECAEGGGKRLTEERVKAGKSGAKVVKAVENPPDSGIYVEVSETALTQIEDAVKSAEISPVACVSRREIPLGSISDAWFLRASKKVPGSLAAVAVLFAALQRDDKAVFAKWSYRGRQHRVAIVADDGALIMLRMRYAQETREPDGEVLAPGAQTVDTNMVDLMAQILGALPQNFSLAEAEDESITLKAGAVQAALSGKPAPTVAPEEAQSSVPDLMAALQAAAASAPADKPKPKKKKPTGAVADAEATIAKLAGN